MIPSSFIFLGLSLQWVGEVAAQGVPPAWAGWPECAFACADGLGCEVPQDRCVCFHTSFLACVTFSQCGSDDADLTREKWDALCTYEPTGSSSTSTPSSTPPTSTPATTSTSIRTGTSAPTSTSTSRSTTASTTTPQSATSRSSATDSPSQPTITSVSESQQQTSSQVSTTGFTSTTPPPVSSATTSSSDGAGIGSSDGTNQDSVALERKRTNTGAIVGGVLGGLAGLALLLAILLYRKRLKREKARASATQPTIQEDQYVDEKGRRDHTTDSNPERLVTPYEKGHAWQQAQAVSPGPMESNASPVNLISPFDARPTERNLNTGSENPKARVVHGNPELSAASPFDLKPVLTGGDSDEDIYGGVVDASGPQGVAQQNVYIPRSSMEKGHDPFADPSSQNHTCDVTPASPSGSSASPLVVFPSMSMENQVVDSNPVVTYAVDSAATAVEVATDPSGPPMVYAMDSEVQPPPYIRP